MIKRPLLTGIIVAALWSVHSGQPARADRVLYAVTDVGNLGGTDGSHARAINDIGQVVGSAATSQVIHHQWCSCSWITCSCLDWYSDVQAGFLWFDGVMTKATPDDGDLDDINDAGQAAGTLGDSDRRAVRWQDDLTTTELGTLGGTDSVGRGVNRLGDVVGWSYTTDYDGHAFLWRGAMIDLGTLGGSSSDAAAINDHGLIVGHSTTIDGEYQAFVLAPRDVDGDGNPDTWFLDEDADGANDLMIALGTLGGTEGIDEAEDINSAGRVVGHSTTADGQTHAFVVTPLDTDGDERGDVWYQDADGNGVNDLMRDLGTLGGTSSYAKGINSLGLIIGTSTDIDGNSRACFWEADGDILDLNSLLVLSDSMAVLQEAEDINDKGQICGAAVFMAYTTPFVANPIIYSTLTTAASGDGTIEGAGEYEQNAEVTITAIPADKWVFDHWEGDASGQTNPFTISLDTDKTVTAIFVPRDDCPDDPAKMEAGICGCGVPDVDADADGAFDCQYPCPDDPTSVCGDECPNDPDKTVHGACGCGTPDTDTDADGTPDCHDPCPEDPTNACGDACPNEPAKTAPGVCGCGVPDIDSDNDGTPDCHDSDADGGDDNTHDTRDDTQVGPTPAGLCGAGMVQAALLALTAVQLRRLVSGRSVDPASRGQEPGCRS